MLTGNKDVDRKILNNLEDKDLVNVCQTNKKANILCDDQVFWMNRVFNRFGYVGGDVLRKNKKDRTWSEYYIKDLRKINKDNAYDYLSSGSRNGRLDKVMISLNLGADIHVRDNSALRYASGGGHLEVVKYLIENGANISARYNEALILASGRGYLDIVKYLIENGANIHSLNDTPLRLARMNGHLNVVEYLESL